MRTIPVFIAGIFLAVALNSSNSLSADDHSYIGFYGGLKSSRIEVDLPGKGVKRFEVTDKTIVNNVGLMYRLQDIPKHSRVKIVDRNGVAILVIVLEVSK